MTSFTHRYSAFNPQRISNSQLGFRTPIGVGDALAKSLYCGMKPIGAWDCERSGSAPNGGVFNLEFSPEGSLLVAACEKKCILLFDPLTHKKTHSVMDAHSDCVNCVKFLDGRMFATCSDDTTIALWDVRNLKKKIRALLGHSNWVKNIEYSLKDNLLVTSGLDGSIYTWDINSYTEWSLVYQRVFNAPGLMRCRISPDASQMIMCTTGGLLVIIHNLNLSTLAKDLHGFKPNLYRLMQMSQQLIPLAACYEHLFDVKRTENRIEFVTDFPAGNDAEVVSSLQIHPHGWSALSRNISHDDKSEWTCIHDIQAHVEGSDKSVVDDSVDPPTPPRRLVLRRTPRRMRLNPRPPPRAETRSAEPRPCPERQRPADQPEPEAGPSNEERSPDRSANARVSGIQNDVWEASISIKQHRMLQEMASRGQVGRNFNMQRIMGINTGITPPPAAPALPIRARMRTLLSVSFPASVYDRLRPSPSGSTPRLPTDPGPDDPGPEGSRRRANIRQNKDRLLYFTEETNEGRGFIKELCFSADGRLVCSPFGHGMRLLALNEHCSELSHCVDEASGPKPMVEVGQSVGIHDDLVVSSKFSPRHHLLVTGCLAGKIVWYQPFSGEGTF